ncbi:MAG: (d)CMP kinase [Planctomycetota bacterium]
MASTKTLKPKPAAPTRGRTAVPIKSDLIITIDGPAGTGKSTVARLLAARLGLDFLDTGAMYRAAAAIVIDHGLDPANVEAVVTKIGDADLHFDWQTDPPAILAWMKPLNDRIRQADVTKLVSPLAALGQLREHMVRKQRLIAQQHPRLVSEGRDQGSLVFPDADVKFYLDADVDVRAQRRAEQLAEAGQPVPEPAQLRTDIRERDERDMTRDVGPLVCPDDALTVDTGPLSLDAVVDRLEAECRARIKA